jgi:hypothetical protein
MTALTLNLTEAQALTVVRSFLLSILPVTVEVFRGQDNRVPEPQGMNFIVLTPVARERLALNTVSGSAIAGTREDLQPVQVTIQIDVHGDLGADNVQLINTLFHSDVGADYFTSQNSNVAPLYITDPHQIAFLNGEHQVETRWTMDMAIQCNVTVSTQQGFAEILSIAVRPTPA